jgi:hypothetical protein
MSRLVVEWSSLKLLYEVDKGSIGTIWEAGAAFALDRKIVYFCENLPPGSKFNLMLSRSGIKVCTTFEQLEDYLNRCKAAGAMIYEPYDKEIE